MKPAANAVSVSRRAAVHRHRVRRRSYGRDQARRRGRPATRLAHCGQLTEIGGIGLAGPPAPQPQLRTPDPPEWPGPPRRIQRPDHRPVWAWLEHRDIRAHLREIYDVDVSPDQAGPLRHRDAPAGQLTVEYR